MACSPSHVWTSIFLSAATSTALAAVITPGAPSGNGGTATISVAPGSRGGNNHFEVIKNFTTLGPIDIPFTVTPSGSAPASSQTFSERVVNRTGVSWFDFHVEVGIGTGENFRRSNFSSNVQFGSVIGTANECSSATSTDFGVDVGPSCGLTPFTTKRSNTALDFVTKSPNITVPDASAVENGHQINLFFVIDVPNSAQSFTLRQIPTTDGKILPPAPVLSEPSTLALVFMGIGAFGYTSCRRRLSRGSGQTSPCDR